MVVEWFLYIGHFYLPTEAERLWNYFGTLVILICQQKQKDCGFILVHRPFLFICCQRQYDSGMRMTLFIGHSYLPTEAVRLLNNFCTLAILAHLSRRLRGSL